MDTQWGIVSAAIGVGFLVGLTGVGGGAIMTPLLVGVFGVPIATAIATDLLFATATKIAGTGVHHRRGNINWKVASYLWAGSVPGVIAGIGVLVVVANNPLTDWLTYPLVAVVLMTAIVLARRSLPRSPGATLHVRNPRTPRKKSWLTAPAGGFGIGLAVALTSVGAGALGMALLVRISPPDAKPQELVGTDLVHAIPVALVGGIAYGFAGLVSWGLLTVMLIGSIPGVLIGSLFSDRVKSEPMNGILACILVVAAVLVLVK